MNFKKLLISLLIAALGLLSIPFAGFASAKAEAVQVPSLDEFSSTLTSANGLAGLYASNTLALPIVHQPSGNPAFVSSQPGVVTEFAMANQYNTTGLLAHNTLAGAEFSRLSIGQNLVLVYANGERKTYQITAIERYQALSPNSASSNFISLADPAQQLTATDLFNHVYATGDRLVLQTCIANHGQASWGRLFIIAQPVTHHTLPIASYQPIPAYHATSFVAMAH